MNTIIRLLAVVFIVLITRPAHANIVGYYNYVFSSGDTLFTSQFDNSPNVLTNLFKPSSVFGTISDGTSISVWNSTTETFSTASTYSAIGGWSVNLTLQAGTGYLLSTFATFTNTFAGSLLNHDGTLYSGVGDLILPPVYAGLDGIFLLADKTAIVDTGTNIFLNILGRLPNAGEQVITLSSTNTYLGGGSWSGGIPTLKVGDAAFLNIISPVPEPSTAALGLLGFALVHFLRRRWL
jgi:hypothetical protein